MQIIVFIMGLIRGAVLTLIYIFQMLVFYGFISVPIILCVVAVPFVFRLLRAAFVRLRFVGKIKRAVNKKGGKVIVSRIPLASLFVNNGKIDMYVDVCGERYALKYFPWNPLNRKVYIHDSECAYTSRRKAQAIFGRGVRGRVDLIFNKADTKMKKCSLKGIPVEHKTTILVISPSPYEIYVYDGNQYRMTGNGEKFQNLTLYTDNGFIEFLQRQ